MKHRVQRKERQEGEEERRADKDPKTQSFLSP